MTDYKEEQSQEIEALQAIYPEELNVLSEEPFHSFEITLISQSDHDEAENVSCTMQFTYTSKYPDEAPVMGLECDLEDIYVDQINQLMAEQAEENLGMVMVFTIVSAVQEKLDSIVTNIATEQVEERERKIREHEEAERKKFEGTRTTIEAFLAWKEKFNAEIAEKKRLAGHVKEKKAGKLTGKQLFLQDNTFDDSDVRFLEEEGDKVEVDESLFDDLDELDLEDDIES